MQKIRFIEIPHRDKGNGLRYGKIALEMINAVRTELHALDVDLWGCRMAALFRLRDENRTSK